MAAMIFTETFRKVVLALLLASPLLVSGDRRLTIINQCPEVIPVYVNGQLQNNGTPIASGGTFVRSFPDDWTGLVYTNANAPNSPGNSGVGTTRVGFANQAGYYYIVKDPEQFNTGVSVIPDAEAADGFCPRVTCNSQFCANSHLETLNQFPAPGEAPPAPPLYVCPSTPGFTVRFCPSTSYPRTDGTVRFHPNGETRRCLDAGSQRTNGAAVGVTNCSATVPSQRWKFTNPALGELTRVELVGTDYCLSVGVTLIPGESDAEAEDFETKRLRLHNCDESQPGQAFVYAPRSQLVLDGSTPAECLSLRGETGEVIQALACVNSNSRQRWTVT